MVKLQAKGPRPFSKNTMQYLTFVGHCRHPIVRSANCSFLSVRFPKISGGRQEFAYRNNRAARV